VPAINFRAEFAGLVESGRKRQTIRALRADCRNPRPGQTLYLYVGLRTKGCRKLGEAVCVAVDQVTIEERRMILRGEHLSLDAADHEAEKDGFPCFMNMRDWFERKRGLPFDGLRIRWEAIRVPGEPAVPFEPSTHVEAAPSLGLPGAGEATADKTRFLRSPRD
jgi:hypothetical protein